MACKICEMNNVLAAIMAFTMSIMAVMMSLTERSKVIKAMAETGDGAHLAAIAQSTFAQLILSMIINGFACLCVCLSTFDCIHAMKYNCVHSITSSTCFCIMRIICFLTFLVQTALANVMTCGFVGMSVLAYICSMGSTTVFHAQEVIWEVGNFTRTGVDPFDPYRTGNFQVAKAADTPGISASKTFQHLELAAFCPNGKVLAGAVGVFWMACVLSLVSQALMAIALNGEKERVSVHEQHEAAGGVSTRDITENMGLLGSTVQASAMSGLQNFQNSYDQYARGARGH